MGAAETVSRSVPVEYRDGKLFLVQVVALFSGEKQYHVRRIDA